LVEAHGPVVFLQARLDILRIHSRRMNLMRGINLKKVADTMGGCSGAEVKACRCHLLRVQSVDRMLIRSGAGCVFRGWYVRAA
jgi:ATP-dependent 26S proteasome regulatory subunit